MMSFKSIHLSFILARIEEEEVEAARVSLGKFLERTLALQLSHLLFVEV